MTDEKATGVNPERSLTQLEMEDLIVWRHSTEKYLGPLVNQHTHEDGWVFGVDDHLGVWQWTHPKLEGTILATWYWNGDPWVPVAVETVEGDEDQLDHFYLEATGAPEADAKIYYHAMRSVLARALVKHDREQIARRMLNDWRRLANITEAMDACTSITVTEWRATQELTEAKLLEILELMGVDL
jgi:hypothetical protein